MREREQNTRSYMFKRIAPKLVDLPGFLNRACFALGLSTLELHPHKI
jgi:hypothetical protein